ncbi:MAG: ABC transporter ATP-binding protein [Deltaproteobacteria bacterium]|nr:ABC transporter ATP-binding protein [Deltaproteobacteria bacterium]
MSFVLFVVRSNSSIVCAADREPEDRKILRYYDRIKFLVERYRRLILLGLLSLVATDLAGIALPWLIKGGIDHALHARARDHSNLYFPLLILGAAALQGLFRFCWRINIHGFSRRCEADLRDRVFSHMQRLPLSYFQYQKTGDLMSRLTNDIHAVRELMGFGSLAIVDALVVILFSLALMITIDPWLTLWSMLAMPLIPIVVRYFGRQIFRWSRATQEQVSEMSAYVLENFSGIRVVQAYAQEENQIRGFSVISSEYRHRTMWLATLWGVFWPLMQVHAGVAATIVLWLGGRQVLLGSMTLGEFVAFNGYLAMLTWPLMAIGYTANQYQRGTAALSRIAEVLDTPVGARYLTEATVSPPPAVSGAIEFRRLTFAYGADQPAALRGITLSIPAGAVCGIIGETGAGKSTLVQALLRLHEPADETIFIDGIDVKKLPLRTLQSAVGYVSQDIFLFSGSVRDNLLLGVEDGAPEQVERAARVAQLTSAVESFSAGFETIIGERGVRLSGGQKQRTALARAIVKEPPIMILDDAFSSVDTETEEAILRELKQFMRGRTTLLISHRISTVRDADMIVYLRGGEIIEQGSHAELLARRGAYYELYRRQSLEREVAAVARAEAAP